ncbi:MAG: hypothetical protein AB2811_10190 [Candidatus Sedimenticola endophacoides]
MAEQEELDFKHPPERTPQLFERYLPYAIALDLEQRWGERFSSLLHTGEDGYQPHWYQGNGWHGQGFTGFASALGSGMGAAVSAASTPPGSASGSVAAAALRAVGAEAAGAVAGR